MRDLQPNAAALCLFSIGEYAVTLSAPGKANTVGDECVLGDMELYVQMLHIERALLC